MRLPVFLLTAWILLAIGSYVLPLDPYRVSLETILAPPSAGHWLGTDELGRPVLDRLMQGARISLLVAVATVLVSATIGITVGLVAGYLGGLVDRIVGRVIDVFLAFPGMLLAIAMAAMLGPGIDNVIVALSVMGWVGYARLVRVQVMTLRRRDHVLAAQALGRGQIAIMRRHLLPLVAPHLVLAPGVALFGVVLAANLFGDTLRDRCDVTLRSSS